MVRQIKLQNLLSFGPETPPLPLENLNILIGPNGSGKSNLIEALALIRSTPGDMRAVVRRGGGTAEWIWKGQMIAPATIELVANGPKEISSLRHTLEFLSGEQGFLLADERIETQTTGANGGPAAFSCRCHRGVPTLRRGAQKPRVLASPMTFGIDASVLSWLRDPEAYPELSFLAEFYKQIRIYREWALGRSSVLRQPQAADLRNDRLEEDLSNIGLFLSLLCRNPKTRSAILNGLRDLYDGVTGFDVFVQGGAVQVFLTEGDFAIPATRLSDGTLRYLCLLAILCDPAPPPLICIEEPELGLHPDILPKLADLLVAASTRTQLIVTTHSDILVDAMTERPEAVVVCEKHERKTEMRRLKRDELAKWLDKYRLGQLWTEGQLGGTRW
ncbi:MAG: AAA family ATPase [Planctomycetota bacterium]